MGKTKEESLTNINKQSLFDKVKMFFQKMFSKKEQASNIEVETKNTQEEKDNFKETIKNTEDSQTELLKLQKRFRNGEIKDGDLTQDQIDRLCELYDMQIQTIKQSIEIRRKRIEEYRKNN